MDAHSRCPYKPGSSYAERWIASYEKALANLGLEEDDVLSTPEVYATGGYTHRTGRHGIEMLEASNGPAPRPVMVVQRCRFYLRSDIDAWLAPRRAIRDRVAVRKQERAARSERFEQRLGPTRSKWGFKGVRGSGPGGRWFNAYASLGRRLDGQNEYIGTYTTAEDAALAVDKFRMRHGFPPVNFSDRVDEHERIDIDTVWRSRYAGQWLLETLRAAGRPMSPLELWQVHQAQDLPRERRYNSRVSLAASLTFYARRGEIARPARGLYSAVGDA